MSLARPDLPPHHPQNIPLRQWTDGWLALEVHSRLDEKGVCNIYLIMHPEERRAKGYPVTRAEMLNYIIADGTWLPAAGIGEDSDDHS